VGPLIPVSSSKLAQTTSNIHANADV